MSFDTIIRNGTVVTASDIFRCDVGISGGRITALADDLGDAPEIIDATGLLVMPGGIDSHVHLDQVGTHFRVKAVAVHGEVCRRVSMSDQAGQDWQTHDRLFSTR